MIKKTLVTFAVILGLASVAAAGQLSFEIGTSTPANTVVLMSPGTSGNFVGVVFSSGAAGDFCDVFDSSATTNVALGGDGKSSGPASKRIATLLVTATNTTTATPAINGGPFTNGLAIVCKNIMRAVVLINQ